MEANICVSALRALAEGNLRHWTSPLPACTRSDAEAALGPSEPGPDGVGDLAAALTMFRRYPASRLAPHGCTVWLDGEHVGRIDVPYPAISAPVADALGPPEATTPSGLHAMQDQWIYATRGFTAHVKPATEEVSMLYVYPPMTVTQFLASDLCAVSYRRMRRI